MQKILEDQARAILASPTSFHSICQDFVSQIEKYIKRTGLIVFNLEGRAYLSSMEMEHSQQRVTRTTTSPSPYQTAIQTSVSQYLLSLIHHEETL